MEPNKMLSNVGSWLGGAVRALQQQHKQQQQRKQELPPQSLPPARQDTIQLAVPPAVPNHVREPHADASDWWASAIVVTLVCLLAAAVLLFDKHRRVSSVPPQPSTMEASSADSRVQSVSSTQDASGAAPPPAAELPPVSDATQLAETRAAAASYVQVGQTMAPLGGSYVDVSDPEPGADFEMVNRVKWHETSFTH